jgi:hypothetical protein
VKTPLASGDKNLSSLIKCGQMEGKLYRAPVRTWKDDMSVLNPLAATDY